MISTRIIMLACLLSIALAENIFYTQCFGQSVVEQHFCKLNFDNCTAQSLFQFPRREKYNYLMENANHHCGKNIIAIPTLDKSTFGMKGDLFFLDLNTMQYKFPNLSRNIRVHSGVFDKENPNLFYAVAFINIPYNQHVVKIDFQTQTTTPLGKVNIGYPGIFSTSDFDSENKILYATMYLDHLLIYDTKNQEILKDLRQDEFYVRSIVYDHVKKRVFVLGYDTTSPNTHLYQLVGDSFKKIHALSERGIAGSVIYGNKLYILSNLGSQVVALTEYDLNTMQEVKIHKCKFNSLNHRPKGLIKRC